MRSLWVMVLIATTSFTPGVYAEPEDAVAGLWSTGSSLLRIERQGDTLSATVVALKEPTYTEGEDSGPVGAPRRDDRNPDVDQRSRLLLGINLVSEYTFDGKKWQGKIYDPESGKTYSSNMKVGRDGVLKMRGYVGVPMFGRTAEFVPATRCTDAIKRMLAAASLQGC